MSTKPYTNAFVNSISNDLKETKTIKNLEDFKSLHMSCMPSYGDKEYAAGAYGEGNCGPTAVTTIIKYWDNCRDLSDLLINDSTNDSYTKISKLLNYKPSTGTYNNKYSGAIKNYAKERGYKATVDSYWFDSWSDFTRDIKANKTILVSVGGINKDGESSGHACVAFGYRITSDGTKYLQVANGWNNSPNTYLKFDAKELRYLDGYAVSIAEA